MVISEDNLLLSNSNMHPEKSSNAKCRDQLKINNHVNISENSDFWKNYDYYTKSVEIVKQHSHEMPKGDSQYSYYQIYMPKYRRGLRYAYMSNVCINMYSFKILYFYPSDNPNYRRITEIINRETEHFRWGASFTEIPSVFPSSYHPVLRNKHIAITIAAWGRHLLHTLETVSTVLNVVTNPNYLKGPVDYFIYPNIDNEIEYNLAIMSVIRQYAEINHIQFLYGQNSFQNFNINIDFDPIVCFDQLILVDRNEYPFGGGFFSSLQMTDLIRAAIYHNYQLFYERHNTNIYNLLILKRLSTRRFFNEQEILFILDTYYQNSIHYSTVSFEGKTFEEQMKTMYYNDIILISHGQAEVALFFVKPESVVIEANLPYFYERYGHILSIFYRLYIINPNTQYSTIYPHESFDVCLKDSLLITYGGNCKEFVKPRDIYITKEYLKAAFQEALDHLNGINFDTYLPPKSYLF
ncbi:hypothetical protein WA158_002967 [Blastocystis sp. Blastoise]